LKRYKGWLDAGTYDGLGRVDEPMSRYHSLALCVEYLSRCERKEVLELGTARSFVDGKYPGCNEPDERYWKPNDPSVWDWGAGLFGLMVHFSVPGVNLTTVDIARGHLERCAAMMRSFAFRCSYVCSDSVSFLKSATGSYPLVYLDTGDVWPIEPTVELQLREAEAIVENRLVEPGGILLVDDVLNATPARMGAQGATLGKSQKALPFLLANGFEAVFEGYQYVLKKI